MRGLFLFDQLRELVFYECDDHLWNSIYKSGAEEDDESVYGSFVPEELLFQAGSNDISHKRYSSFATGYIIQFFAPLLASQLFLTSELGDGIHEIEGDDESRIMFTRVTDFTFVLVTPRSHCSAKRLILVAKQVFRMCLGFSLRRIEDLQNEMDLVLFLRRIVCHLHDVVCLEASFVLQTKEHVFIPPEIQSHCVSLLEKISRFVLPRYSVDSAFLTCGLKITSCFSRSHATVFDDHDLKMLPVLVNFCDVDLPHTKACPQNLTQGNYDRLTSSRTDYSASESLSPSTSSFASLPEVSGVGNNSIPFLSLVPDMLNMTLYLRSVDGGIRPHRCTVIEVFPSLRLVLLGKARSNALIPYCYDAVRLLDDHQTRLGSGLPIDQVRLSALREIMDRMVNCPELQKIPMELKHRLQTSTAFVNSIKLQEGTSKTLSSLRTHNSNMEAVINSLNHILWHFRCIDMDPQKKTIFAIGMEKTRRLLRTSMEDYASFLVIKSQTKTNMTLLWPNFVGLLYLVFVCKFENICFTSDFNRSSSPVEFSKITDALDIVASLNTSGQLSTVLFSDGAIKVSYIKFDDNNIPSRLTKKQTAELIGEACKYELYSWYDPVVSDELIHEQQHRLTQHCRELLVMTSVRPQQQSLVRRLLWP